MSFRLSFIASLILFSSLHISCTNKKGSTEKIVSNKIIIVNANKKWNQIIFSLYTPTSVVPKTIFQMLASHEIDTSSQIIEIPAKGPLLFNFAWNFRVQFVYLFPGDTLKFTKTSNDTIPFQFRGSRPSHELMFYSLIEASKLGYLSSGNQTLQVTDKLDYQYVADQSLKRHNTRLQLLNELNAKGKISAQGHQVITQALYYQYLSDLLFPYQAWNPIELSAKNHSIVPNFYKAKLREMSREFDKDSLLYLMDYKSFILNYARFFMLENVDTKKLDQAFLVNFYQKSFRGSKRDLLLFDEIIFDYQRSGQLSPLAEVLDSIGNETMRDTLLSLQKKPKREFSNDALESELETPSGEKYSLREIMIKHSRKMAYLDFWATWCGPCLMEMPDSKKLTQEFKNDSIVFVYLSIDEDRNKWLKKINTLPTGSNVFHYRLAEGKDFTKEMQIPGIPRYMLIGKAGEMISINAPRPRSIEIRELISNYIN